MTTEKREVAAAAAAADGWKLKFVPFGSMVESSFWVKYCQEKLERIKLDETPIDVAAHYSLDRDDSRPILQCRETSLSTTTSGTSATPSSDDMLVVPTKLFGFNTVEAFQKLDKNQFLRDFYLPQFLNKNNEDPNELLCTAALITYADLKAHRVLFWFGFPALMPNNTSVQVLQSQLVRNTWSVGQCEEFSSSWSSLRREYVEKSRSTSCPIYFMVIDGQCCRFSKEAYDEASSTGKSIIFAFVDPSNPEPSAGGERQQPMGWPLRNMIAYLTIHLNLSEKTVRILSFRPDVIKRLSSSRNESDTSNSVGLQRSILLTLMLPHKDDYGPSHKVVGWELNHRGKPGPRWVNLAPLLDPKHLAIQAADLNLKLMKWRMIPNLQVDRLAKTRVLLIGAGTLGCNVARVLLGWGVRHFKIVDYGKVTYSNPVRQSLFTLKDCEDGGKPKAIAAADALREIAADVDSEGIVLSIPMPGHPETQERIEDSVKRLDQLVQETDVVFMLTDTRESRWLPTVMAAAYDKMLINAALGLDSWLVMRHGGGLGCYFCNDVVAPENSMKNRTLDQQCTVTRPGLAPIAAAMATELMVALLHHPSNHHAPAPRSAGSFSPVVSSDRSDTNDAASTSLGVMPHQVRGSLLSYTMMTPTVPAFSCCTACSTSVVERFKNDMVGLVHSVCNSPNGSLLEDLSGWTAFREEANAKMEDLDDLSNWEDD